MAAGELQRSGETAAELVALIEAVLFASTEPVSREELREALAHYDESEIEPGLEALGRALEQRDRGLRLQKIAGGYRLVTREDLAEPLRRLFRFRNRKRLTPASLDVLSIIAYAQPITGPEIQEIRGADPSYSLRVLQERRLIRIVGRKRVVGRPIVYGTTQEFLVHFGLDSLEDLPSVEAYGTRVMPAQKRLFPISGPSEAGDGIDPISDEDDPDAALLDSSETKTAKEEAGDYASGLAVSADPVPPPGLPLRGDAAEG
jgi:segregation and condensation protein B